MVIDHGNGWKTSYYHLRRDSVSVTQGQFVRAGQAIGLMGSSGHSSAPHLHFEVSHYWRSVETLLDPATYWMQPPRYVLDQTTLMYSGITNNYTESHRIERPSDVYVFSQAPGQRFRSWVVVSGLRANSVLQFSAFRPNGSLYSTGSVTAAANYGRSRWSFERGLPTVPDLGTWRVEFRVNGELIGTDSFQVTTTGAPEMRIDDESGNIVLDERVTPINFGGVDLYGIGPTKAFTVVNHGSNTLVLGSVTVPVGFVVTEGLSSSLQPGQSDSFTIGLNTAVAGYSAGQVRIASNDTSESEYNFSVEGVVRSPLTQTLTIGIGRRVIAEGQRTVARVTRSGSLSAPLIVTLQSHDTTEARVPSTVVIPAGAASAIFFIDAIDDFWNDGKQVVRITAAAGGFAVATNYLDVRDRSTLAPAGVAAQTSATVGTPTATLWSSNTSSASIASRSLSIPGATSRVAVPPASTISERRRSLVVEAVDEVFSGDAVRSGIH